MTNIIKNYAGLVKFSHTVFALPFALIAFFYASQGGIEVWLLVKVLLCMVFARNSAMAFNRYADRKIDAINPRTRQREIPRGVISPRNAAIFTIVNSVLFIATTFFINKLSFYLSPVALVIILGYTLTKRFTSLCHIFIGIAISIAPIGAYIAVRGEFEVVPLLLSGLVLTWVSGFDIIYSLQDAGFDKGFGVHSIPSRLGIRGALIMSSLLHFLTLCMVILIGVVLKGGAFYWIGALIFISLLIYQHIIVTPKNLSRINLAFGTLNGIASVLFAIFVITAILVQW